MHRPIRIVRFVLFLLFIGLLTYLPARLLFHKQTIVSPLPDETKKSATEEKNRNPAELKKKIQETIGTLWKNYSVYVKDLKGNFDMGINETVIFTAASVNKIPIFVALYEGIEKASIDPDKTITVEKKDIQDYGTGSIRYDPPGSTYSIKSLARLMMQKSDNTAAYILSKYIVGDDDVQTYMKELGLIQTDLANNKTSNKDMATLLTLIYNGKIAKPALTAEMFSLLKDSDFEARLPALLPTGTTVYHKIGNEVGNVHDVGIVVSADRAYYIGILTSDVTDEEETEKLEAEISKIVFDFL